MDELLGKCIKNANGSSKEITVREFLHVKWV